MNQQEQEYLKEIVQSSAEAFQWFKQANVEKRYLLMLEIARQIESLDEELIETAHQETNLPSTRLSGEKARTVNQWRSYAEAMRSGLVLDVRLDVQREQNIDIRKTMIPLGTVVIFGASNFPFAFSTAGGDTASAIAAGNTVIVKGHPGHPKTAEMMGKAICKAVAELGYPKGIFAQVFGGIETGAELVRHPVVKAVGFTGSFQGGKALFDLAAKRQEPIPVFSEMGSINPLFLMPDRLKNADSDLADQYVGSLTMGTGQFCTNPGVLVVIKGAGYKNLLGMIKERIASKEAEAMLHPGIASNYQQHTTEFAAHPSIQVIAEGKEGGENTGQAVLARTTAAEFTADRNLCGEVFGPFGLIVECENLEEMESVARSLEGQLTCTFLALEKELEKYGNLINLVREKCGRVIFNNFPTGVAVCMAMQHGGPYPASTDSRFSSVGGDAIKRFMRPIAFQNWPESQLPDELRNENTLGVYRTVNGTITKDDIK